jgi:MFS superfamily sulfate permease-like transporter
MSKTYIPFIVIFCFIIFSSFTVNLECEYAESTITIAMDNTKKAIEVDDINQARYYTYKAVNAIEKSKKQLEKCGCTNAKEDLDEGLNHLILATKATTLDSTHELLLKSLDHTLEGLNALTYHDLHENNQNKDIAMANTPNSITEIELPVSTKRNSIHNTIDNSLEKYRLSLDNVVKTVDCKEAYNFTKKIIEQCEKQLLRNDLSDGKKYYYLRTKDFTAKALARIGNCEAN